MSPLGALLGLLVVAGLALAVAASPPLRRPRLESRLAPYLRDAPRPSRLLTGAPEALTPFPTLERIVHPALGDLVRGLDRLMGGAASVRRRLEQAGRDMTVEEFRAEQVVWGGAGLLVGVVLVVAVVASGSTAPPLVLLLLALSGIGVGVILRDRALLREVTQRETGILLEFPTIAELLALAVSAGEGPVGALERVCRRSSGALSEELRRTLDEARAGATLVQALEGLASRTSLLPLARFVDGVAVAVERGTPLAEVLRAQALDVREAGRRSLLEAGGRKEIAMMFPVVFLILPVTVIFSVYPGYYGLQIINR